MLINYEEFEKVCIIDYFQNQAVGMTALLLIIKMSRARRDIVD